MGLAIAEIPNESIGIGAVHKLVGSPIVPSASWPAVEEDVPVTRRFSVPAAVQERRLACTLGVRALALVMHDVPFGRREHANAIKRLSQLRQSLVDPAISEQGFVGVWADQTPSA